MDRSQLTRLVAVSPGNGRMSALVRWVCGRTLSLPPLPADVAVEEPESDAEAVVAAFADQFSVDAPSIHDEHRSALRFALSDNPFGAVVLMSSRGITPPTRRTHCSTVFCPLSRGSVRSIR